MGSRVAKLYRLPRVPKGWHAIDIVDDIIILENDEGRYRLPNTSIRPNETYVLYRSNGDLYQIRKYDENCQRVWDIDYGMHSHKNEYYYHIHMYQTNGERYKCEPIELLSNDPLYIKYKHLFKRRNKK